MTIEAKRAAPVGMGFVRRLRKGMASTALAAALLPLALPPAIFSASASVGSKMDAFLDEATVAANVTGPTAFEGQSAGYYSLGNVWSRFPQKRINPVNLQLPSARAGCGGIDIFGGSFSFINADEIVAMLKATANNAVGFAFSLAIDTVCPECNKIMQEFAQKAQLMNNFSMSSCEMAQGLVGGLWPQGDLADKSICEAIGNKQGIFTDAAAAKHGCGNRGERAETLGAADGEWDDVNTGEPRNYTWHAIRKSDLFQKADGTLDRELAEYAMTLVGTIIYVPPGTGDDARGRYEPIPGDASSELVSALLDGTAASGVQILKCPADDADACLDPALQVLDIAPAGALRPRIAAMIDDMAAKIVADEPLSDPEKALLQTASVPLYKILTVQSAYSRGIAAGDRETLAELVAVDLLFLVLEDMMNEMRRARGAFEAADRNKLEAWRSGIDNVRAELDARKANTSAKVSTVLQIVEKTRWLEGVLAAELSPGMAAALDWSRGVGIRSLN